MKTKITRLILLAVMAALWSTWSLAYQRGYSRGSRDEFACWKQMPTAGNTADYPEGVMTGRRKIWLFPGGKPVPPPRIVHRNTGAKNVITSFSISK